MLIHLTNTKVVNTTHVVTIEDIGQQIVLSLSNGESYAIEDPALKQNLRQALATAQTDDALTVDLPLTLWDKFLKMFTR